LLGAGAGAAAAIGAGLVVRQTVIEQSTQSGGRSLDEIGFYSAQVGDFVSRHVDHARSEQFVFLGWATPLVALAGLFLLIRSRRYALATILGSERSSRSCSHSERARRSTRRSGTRSRRFASTCSGAPPAIASLCIAALFATPLRRAGARSSPRSRLPCSWSTCTHRSTASPRPAILE